MKCVLRKCARRGNLGFCLYFGMCGVLSDEFVKWVFEKNVPRIGNLVFCLYFGMHEMIY